MALHFSGLRHHAVLSSVALLRRIPFERGFADAITDCDKQSHEQSRDTGCSKPPPGIIPVTTAGTRGGVDRSDTAGGRSRGCFLCVLLKRSIPKPD